MKLTLVLACTLAALLVGNTNAQFFGGLGGLGLLGLGGFGAFGPFGPLGFGGLGFGGIAPPGLFGRTFAPVLPHLRPGLPLRNGLALGTGVLGLIGKRDTEGQKVLKVREPAPFSFGRCTFTQDKLNCFSGQNGSFTCDVKLIGNITSTRARFFNLAVQLPTQLSGDNDTTPVEFVELVQRNFMHKTSFAFIDPNNSTEQHIFVFSNQELNLTGFYFPQADCFSEFVSTAQEMPNLRISLNLRSPGFFHANFNHWNRHAPKQVVSQKNSEQNVTVSETIVARDNSANTQ